MNFPEAKQPMNATVAGLMIRQLEEWDNSLFLSDDELIEGLKKDRPYMVRAGIMWETVIHEYRAAYPDAVPYSVIDGSGNRCFGMRYGFRGEQYISF